jgi:hypothetical protein
MYCWNENNCYLYGYAQCLTAVKHATRIDKHHYKVSLKPNKKTGNKAPCTKCGIYGNKWKIEVNKWVE